MKKVFYLFPFAGLLLFTYCTPKFLIPTAGDANLASEKFSGTTLTDLNNGYEIYVSRCNNCHSLKHPKTKTIQEWGKILPKMAHKAKIDLYSKDFQDLKAYIYTLHDRPE